MSPETSFGLTGRPAGGAAYGAATGAASAAMTRAVSGNSVSPAEAKAWASFFSLAASSPAFADEITRLFDADPVLRRHNLALYLRGRACLCRHHARQTRRQRRAEWLKATATFLAEHLLTRPWAALKVLATGQHEQQPLILPAIVWNDRDAVDPPVASATAPKPSAALVNPGAGPASPQTQPATLVH
ncbi:MAG TPA: hypothetical protein PK306_22945 [Aquabacterium sp.]|nr:hypothetical protein [Aquabacterium sp.]